MSLVLQSSGGGQITIQEPATASNFTQTLPAATGTVQVSGNMPAFSAYAGANQTVTLSTFTKIAINTEFFDTNSNFDTTNNRFTPTVAGYYQVNGLARVNAATTFTGGTVTIYKNGAAYRRGMEVSATFNAGASVNFVVSDIIYMNGTTDYLELYANVAGSGTATFQANGASLTSAFSACLLRGE